MSSAEFNINIIWNINKKKKTFCLSYFINKWLFFRKGRHSLTKWWASLLEFYMVNFTYEYEYHTRLIQARKRKYKKRKIWKSRRIYWEREIEKDFSGKSANKKTFSNEKKYEKSKAKKMKCTQKVCKNKNTIALMNFFQYWTAAILKFFGKCC